MTFALNVIFVKLCLATVILTMAHDPLLDEAVEDDALLGINEELDAAMKDAQRDGASYIGTTASDRDSTTS